MSLALIARRCCVSQNQAELQDVQRERQRFGSRTSTTKTRARIVRSQTYPRPITHIVEPLRDGRSNNPDDVAANRDIADAVTPDGRATEFPSDAVTPDGRATEFHSDDVSSDGRATEFPSDEVTPDGRATEFHSDDVTSDGCATEFHSLPNLSSTNSLSDSNSPSDSSPPEDQDHTVVPRRWSASAVSALESHFDEVTATPPPAHVEESESADDSTRVGDTDHHSLARTPTSKKEEKALERDIVVDDGEAWSGQRLSVVAAERVQSIDIGAFMDDYAGLFVTRAHAEEKTPKGRSHDGAIRRGGTSTGRIRLGKASAEEEGVVSAPHLRLLNGRSRSLHRRDLADNWSESNATSMSWAHSIADLRIFLRRRPPAKVHRPASRKTYMSAPDAAGGPRARKPSLPIPHQYQPPARLVATSAISASTSLPAVDGLDAAVLAALSSDPAASTMVHGLDAAVSVAPSSDRAASTAVDGLDVAVSVAPSWHPAASAAVDGLGTAVAAPLLGRETANDDAPLSQLQLAVAACEVAPSVLPFDNPQQDEAEGGRPVAHKKMACAILHDTVNSRQQKRLGAMLPSNVSWRQSEQFASATRPRVDCARRTATSSPLLPSDMSWRQSGALPRRFFPGGSPARHSMTPADGTVLSTDMHRELTRVRSACDTPQSNHHSEANQVTAPRNAGLPSSCPESSAIHNMTAATQWATLGVPYSVPARDDVQYAGCASSPQLPHSVRAATVAAAEARNGVCAVIPPYGVSPTPCAIDAAPPFVPTGNIPLPTDIPRQRVFLSSSPVIPPYGVSPTPCAIDAAPSFVTTVNIPLPTDIPRQRAFISASHVIPPYSVSAADTQYRSPISAANQNVAESSQSHDTSRPYPVKVRGPMSSHAVVARADSVCKSESGCPGGPLNMDAGACVVPPYGGTPAVVGAACGARPSPGASISSSFVVAPPKKNSSEGHPGQPRRALDKKICPRQESERIFGSFGRKSRPSSHVIFTSTNANVRATLPLCSPAQNPSYAADLQHAQTMSTRKLPCDILAISPLSPGRLETHIAPVSDAVCPQQADFEVLPRGDEKRSDTSALVASELIRASSSSKSGVMSLVSCSPHISV